MSRWLQFSVILSAVLQIIFATAVVANFSINVFEKELKPAEQQKAIVVNQLLANLVGDMLGYGIPIDRIRGMEQIFSHIQRQHPNIIYLAVEDAANNILYERSKPGSADFSFFSVADTSFSLTDTSNQPKGHQLLNVELFTTKLDAPNLTLADTSAISGQVRMGIDRDYFVNKQKEITLDVVTVLVVSALMAVELLVFLFVFTIRSPMRRLFKAIGAISAGKFSQVFEFNTPDEVGRCGQLLNQIILKVNQRHFDAASASTDQLVNLAPENLSNDKRPSAKNISSFVTRMSNSDAPVTNSDTRMSNVDKTPALQFGMRGSLRCSFDQALVYMRPPLFLVVFAESMSLSFFPAFVDELYLGMDPLPLSKELVMGLPISIFMLVWALSLPFAGQWSDRAGRRKAFIFGSILTSAGLILTSQSGDIYQLVFWRSITALGYGVVFITAQSYVTDLTTAANRTKGMAMFLSGFFSGSLCGAAIGGILADRIGYEATFVLSAVLATLASLFAARFFVDHAQDLSHTNQPAPAAMLAWRDVRKLFADRSFLLITFLAAIPAKAALTGFIYYIGPVYLSYLGATKSVSGRILMAYGLAIVIISPLTALLIDKYQQQKSFIVLGGLLSSSALLIVGLSGDINGLGIGVLLLGVAHACSISPQSSLITATVVHSSGVAVGKTIGIYRLTERIGNISGPLLAGILITAWGFESAFIAFSVFLGISSLLFLYFMRAENPTSGLQLGDFQRNTDSPAVAEGRAG